MKQHALPFIAFILAGGLGKRLRSVVSDRPKPLATVHGRPFLDILIESLAQKGVEKFVLLAGYRSEMIEDYFRSRVGADILFSREEKPLGTGGAVKLAEGFATDPTLLVNGDTFFDADLEALLGFHMAKRAEISLSLTRVADVSRYGSVVINEKGYIQEFAEKSESFSRPGFINAGVSLLSLKSIQDLPSAQAFSMETEIFPTFVGTRRMAALYQDRPFFDIGTPESYEEFKRFAKIAGLVVA